MANGARMTVL